VTPVSAVKTARLLRETRDRAVAPGYGMAVAQAQYTVFESTRHLREEA